MPRVDVAPGDVESANNRSCGQSNHIVRTAAGIYYRFFVSLSDADLYYQKSTNYGMTWGVPVLWDGSITCIGLAVWFDKWTPGDSGTLIHTAWMETTNNDIRYRTLDTATDTPGTEIVVFDGASFTAGASTCLSITKSVGGRIYIAFDPDGGAEDGCYRSDDYPPTAFSAIDNSLQENTSDYYMLFPGNETDTDDIYALFVDRSAGGFSLKTYSDTGNTWSETALIADGSVTALASTTAIPQFSGAVRNSDGHLFGQCWTSTDAANADLRIFDITNAATITERTNVVLNSGDDQGMCALCINTTDDKIYSFYFGKSDGSETWNTSLGVYYKTSTDSGVTWSAEATLSTDVRARAALNCTLETDSDDIAVAYLSTGVWSGGSFVTFNSAFYTSGSGGNANILRGSVIA